MRSIVEVCCGSYYDVKQAVEGGAKRVELNCGLYLGGLTPSISALDFIKKDFSVQVIAMVRPRGAGFCYLDEDFRIMEADCQLLLDGGADGIAFGCLDKMGKLDYDMNSRIINRIKNKGKEAVFHRAFDCCENPWETTEQLIQMGIDRILTSGLEKTAWEGRKLLAALNKEFGSRIQFLMGSGINAHNAGPLMEYTLIHQVHSSCKEWLADTTTSIGHVSYAYGGPGREQCYDAVSAKKVRKLIEAVENRKLAGNERRGNESV